MPISKVFDPYTGGHTGGRDLEKEDLHVSVSVANQNSAIFQSQRDQAISERDSIQTSLTSTQAELSTANTNLATAQSDLSTANATIIELQDQLANSSGGGAPSPHLGDLNNFTFFAGQTPADQYLTAYSYDSVNKIHSFTTSDLTYSNADWSLGGGANFTGPRWYTPMTYNDGTPVLIGDQFSFSVSIDNLTKDANLTGMIYALDFFNAEYINSYFDRSYLSYMKPAGFYASINTSGAMGFGTHISNNTLFGLQSGNAYISGAGTIVTSPGSVKSTRPTICLTSSGYDSNNVTSTRDYYFPSSSELGKPLSLGLFVGTHGSVAATGGTASMRINYSIGKLS